MFSTIAAGRYAPAEEFVASDSAAFNQGTIRVASLPDGGFVAVWAQSVFDDFSIKAQRFDANGREVGDEFTVKQMTDDVASNPSVAMLESGNFVVTWTEERPLPNAFDIKAQMFTAGGVAVGSEVVVNTRTAGFQGDAVVTTLAGGGYVVSWHNTNQTTGDDVRAQVFRADGTRLTSEILAADAGPGVKYSPTTVGLSGGGFVVAWLDPGAESDANGNLNPGVRAQVFDGLGRKLGTAFSLNSIAAGEQEHPALAALPDGGFVAAWADDGNTRHGPDNGNRGIWIQNFDSAGNKVGDDRLISDLNPVGQDMPVIEMLPGVGFVVAWRDGNSTAEHSGAHLRGQLFNFDGNALGDEFALNSDADGQFLIPDLVALGGGGFAAGWTQRSAPSFNDDDVHLRLFFPALSGTAGNDSFAGTVNRDFYNGAGGADSIAGGAEADSLDGGDGDDVIRGGDGNDTIDAGGGNDESYGDGGDDHLVGADGNDRLDGGSGSDTAEGGLGADEVFGGLNSDALAGGGDNDRLSGGEGDDDLRGDAGDDTLQGDGGADRLDGGTGTDSMAGGAGNDIYVVDHTGDTAIDAAGNGGVDTVESSIAYTLGANLERLTLTGVGAVSGTGNALANVLVGNSAANLLRGGDGDDALAGGGGDDTMDGGLGNDRYFVEDFGDKAVEASPSGGTDTIETTITFSLAGQYIENLTLLGWQAIDGTGNGLANILIGNEGGNVLDGGTGADLMRGGLGNDRYIVDVSGDRVEETVFGGMDTLETSLTFSLSGIYVENLTLTGSRAINGTGNGLGNSIFGNAAANVLTGAEGNDGLNGGAGGDSMYGGTGHDHYVVDDSRDRVVEAAGAGTDTVVSSVTFSLVGNYLENLSLSGIAAIDATGNGLDNVLAGNFASNVLTGSEGADTLNGNGGDDVMNGGTGADRYIVQEAGDRVVESSLSGGTDRVESWVTFSLAGQYVENLTLRGYDMIDGTGNSLANIMVGNEAANRLIGGDGADRIDGGWGADTLTGGGGADGFQFESPLAAWGNVDDILDFSVADDTVFLSRSVFSGIGANGTLASAVFVDGTAAADADDRVLYDKGSGNIFYDGDGLGGAGAVLFAQVTAGTELTHLDFSAYLPS